MPTRSLRYGQALGRPGEAFEPRHTTHGFRYVRIEGHPGPLTADDVTGVVVHTELTRTGWFTSSDDTLNRLHEAAVWSLRGNVCDMPTDCPQRERAAWTGDWQIFAPTAAFLYAVAGFTAKWLRDLAADQWADGVVPNFVPNPANEGTRRASAEGGMNGSAGWGDAAVIVPWEMWRAYGDLDLLHTQYPSMRAWVDFAAHHARTRRHPDRATVRPQAAPHESSCGTPASTSASGWSPASPPTWTPPGTAATWPPPVSTARPTARPHRGPAGSPGRRAPQPSYRRRRPHRMAGGVPAHRAGHRSRHRPRHTGQPGPRPGLRLEPCDATESAAL
ncbi:MULTISPECIES: family 78 glycoside hydrolase catalytic domain [unclassified Streptomyces]|uniref:family 78 glycoside hydrolase catalytic domain n=1 Tax=unclassified Streptomyces TaxID=2593676 RepID=UPI0040419C36